MFVSIASISDVVFWSDCFVLQGLIAAATERIHIGSMVTNPYTRHPVVLAAMVATLQEISNGRAFLGIGVGAGLEDLALEYERPVRTLREAITAIRDLLSGAQVDQVGEVFAARGQLFRPPITPVPISVGTRSPQVMRLAGELADIALVGARHITAPMADRYRSWLAEGERRAGRESGSVEVAPRLTLCFSTTPNWPATASRYVAHYLAIIRPEELGEDRPEAIDVALARSSGWYFDLGRHDDPELFDLVPPDWITRYAVVGSPSDIVEQLRAVADLGFTSVSLNLAAVIRPSMSQGLAETIDGFGRAGILAGR